MILNRWITQISLPFLVSLFVLFACGSEEDEKPSNPNNPNQPVTPLTDETRLAALARCDVKATELNELKSEADQKQFIAWVKQQPEFRTAGLLDGSGTYAVFTDERVAFFVDTPLTGDPPDGGRKRGGESTDAIAEDKSAGRANQIARTMDVPKSKQVTLYNGMGAYFNTSGNNAAALEKIFNASLSKFSVTPKDATIENLKTVSGDGIFYIFTHGGGGAIPKPAPEKDSLYVMSLWTKNKVTPQSEGTYKQLLNEKKVAYMRSTFDSEAREWHYGITAEFIRESMSFAENSIIYLDACNTFRSTPGGIIFRQTVLNKAGAKKATYFGWTNETNAFNSALTSQFIFDRLLGTNTEIKVETTTIPKEAPLQRPFDLAKVYADVLSRGYAYCPNGAVIAYQSTADPQDEILIVPTIEKLEVFESPSEAAESILRITGSFGNEKGKVTVNGVDMENVTWGRNYITCSIPDGGEAYAGNVIVSVHDLQSNPVPLTAWELQITYATNDNGIKMQGVIDLKLRADVHPRRTFPGQQPSRPEYPDLSPSSGYPFHKSSKATYDISGQKYAKCNWDPCPNTFEETPHVKSGTASYQTLTSPSNAPKLLALYNWSPDRKSIRLTHLSVNLPDITTTTYYHLADCPGEDQEVRNTELTSMNFNLPNDEIDYVIHFDIADNYNIRTGGYSTVKSRPWNPCDGSGSFEMSVSWPLAHPHFAPDDTTPARVRDGD
jgi:hypothetical protein